MGILVIGSFMMDLVVRTPRAPQNGETIIGTSFSQFPGGKGANQAVAAARLGGDVTMVGKVGNDPFGDEALATIANENINIDYFLRDDKLSTGVGSVTLEADGNNRIIVVPGANMNYLSSDLEGIKDIIKKSDLLIVQLEMDLKMTEDAVAYAAANNVPVILNPAPAQELSDELLANVTYLTPNETEAEILTGIKVETDDDAVRAGKALLNKGVKNVVMTLAEKGCLVLNENGPIFVPGFPVTPVDTVAAGDSFNGALAVGIVNGIPLEENVRYANAVGALTVSKEGAIPSLPYAKDVEKFMKEYK